VLDAIPGLYGSRRLYHRAAANGRHASRAESRRDDGRRRAAAFAKFHGDAADAICRTWLADGIRAGAFGDATAREFTTSRGPSVFARVAPMGFSHARAHGS
jgi:hypothetical protein